MLASASSKWTLAPPLMFIVLPMSAPLKLALPEIVKSAPRALIAPMNVPPPETVTFWLVPTGGLMRLMMLLAALVRLCRFTNVQILVEPWDNSSGGGAIDSVAVAEDFAE